MLRSPYSFAPVLRLMAVACALTLSPPAPPAQAQEPPLPLFLQFEQAEGATNIHIVSIEFDCFDPAQEDVFNKWYDEVFVPSELAVPGAVAAWRMKVELPMKRWLRSPERPTYATVFEVHTDDIDAWMLDRAHRMRVLSREPGPSALLNEVSAVAYRSMLPLMTRASLPAAQFAPKAGHPATEVDPTENVRRYVAVIDSNSTDPAQEAVFNKWYDELHVPDVLTAPGYHSAWRLEIVSPMAGRGRYLTYYEIHTDNFRAATDKRDERRVREYMVGAYENSYTSGVSQAFYIAMGDKITKPE